MTTPRADIGAEAVKDADGVPEEKLAAAILHAALEDLEQPQRLCRDDDALANLQEARQFCFSSQPSWKQSREDWCDVAGVEVTYFQKLAAQRCAAALR